MDRFLKLPSGELPRLAGVQRKAELKRELGEEPVPLFREVRELVLRKCHPDRVRPVRAIFEAQPFGELERLVTQRLLDVLTAVAKEELGNEYWLPRAHRISSGFHPQRQRDRGGSRPRQEADAPLLLPGIAEPQGPATLSRAVDRADRDEGSSLGGNSAGSRRASRSRAAGHAPTCSR